MGCDGGTIPRRDELVRLKKKPEQTERDVDLAAKWKHCALSQQLLAHPIVACELGRLYNKDSIIELLLDRSKFEDPVKVEHIKGLKDVKELGFTKNPAYKAGDDKVETYVNRAAEHICPITGLEMTGRYKFQFIWTCACVFAERALKEMKSTTCNKCGKAYASRDVITINAEGEELETMTTNMQERRAQAKLDKKAKKKKAAAEAAGSADEPSSKKAKFSNGVDTKPSNPDSPSTSAAKSQVNGQGSKVKADTANGISTEKLKKKEEKEKMKEEKADKKYKSIQNNPNASAAFKSLFSSSKDAKSKGSAHWVTHNPFYN